MKMSGVMIGTDDSKRLCEFYTKILGKPGMNDFENGWYGFDVEDGTYIVIGPHSEVRGQSKEPPRIMMNFVVDNVQTAFNKIKAAGGKVVAEPYQPDPEDAKSMWLATFADPDGNYLQIGTRWE